MLGLPFAFGAFIAGGLAAGAMLFLSQRSGLKVDVVIGIIFTSFFGLGLFMISLNPVAVSVQTITMGNILAISPEDTIQLVIISVVSLAVMAVLWKDMLVAFFDENHARSIGLRPGCAEGGVLRAAVGVGGCRHADGGRVSGHRHGHHTRRDGLSALRPFSAPVGALGGDRRGNQFRRGLCQLLSRRRDRGHHRGAANARLRGRVHLRAQTRSAERPRQGQSRAGTPAGTTP